MKKDKDIIQNIINETIKDNIHWMKDKISIGTLYKGLYVDDLNNKFHIIFKVGNFPYLNIVRENTTKELFIMGKQYEELKSLIKEKDLKDFSYDFTLIEFLQTKKEEDLKYLKYLRKEVI